MKLSLLYLLMFSIMALSHYGRWTLAKAEKVRAR
jgi:hypothetical protein